MTKVTEACLQRPASQDRAKIVFDCSMADDPAMMSSTNPARSHDAVDSRL
jgi:hypothetical protein